MALSSWKEYRRSGEGRQRVYSESSDNVRKAKKTHSAIASNTTVFDNFIKTSNMYGLCI